MFSSSMRRHFIRLRSGRGLGLLLLAQCCVWYMLAFCGGTIGSGMGRGAETVMGRRWVISKVTDINVEGRLGVQLGALCEHQA